MFSVVFCTLFPCGYTAGGCTPYNPLCHCQWLSGIRRLRHQNTFESPFRGHLWYPHGRMVKRIDEMNLKADWWNCGYTTKKNNYLHIFSMIHFLRLNLYKLWNLLQNWGHECSFELVKKYSFTRKRYVCFFEKF